MLLRKKVALVDFDGVILRNKQSLQYTVNRVEKFVSVKTGIKCEKMLKQFNTELYQSYGHTFLGLQDLGYTKSLKEFNSFVYGGDLRPFSLTDEEKKEWSRFKNNMSLLDIKVQLFSNSSPVWMSHFTNYDETFEVTNMISSFPDSYFSKLLKPKIDIYTTIYALYPNHDIVFIDDKLSNFRHVTYNTHWHNFWITNNSLSNNKLSHNIITCKNLDDVTSFIKMNICD